ncbi:MAG TPA: thiamine-phosphate kinase [Gemmatimonadaceae bacterium]|nr:thiamine-phosphate kinase [Gemmatimonadaceae bacterium]
MTDGPHAHLPLGPGAEFDIIRGLIARWGGVSEGTGDDAAVVEIPAGQSLAVSTDSSVENVHFRREWLSPREIGYRAAAAAISDLAAMGAAPRGMTVALTLPERWRKETGSLGDGLADAARETGTPILGGDLTRGADLVIGITVFGTVAHPLTRAGAQPGDSVCVTGRLGGPRLALRAFERGVEPLAAYRERFAHPVPRLKEAMWLAAHGATAGLDCSDGIAADLTHLAAASRVRIVLDLDRLPRVTGASEDDAARSGEEYELIVTGASLDAQAFELQFGIPLTAVGTVERAGSAGAAVRARSNGAAVPLPAGHDHFAEQKP